MDEDFEEHDLLPKFDEGPDHANLKILPPYWFVGFFVFALILDFLTGAGFLRWQIQIGFGLLLLGLGFLLFASAFHMLQSAGSSLSPNEPTQEIITSGPYRFSRNPIYFSYVLFYMGGVILFDLVWGMVLLFPLMYCFKLFVIVPEEAYLSRKFRAEYSEYCAKVRRWL